MMRTMFGMYSELIKLYLLINSSNNGNDILFLIFLIFQINVTIILLLH